MSLQQKNSIFLLLFFYNEINSQLGEVRGIV